MIIELEAKVLWGYIQVLENEAQMLEQQSFQLSELFGILNKNVNILKENPVIASNAVARLAELEAVSKGKTASEGVSEDAIELNKRLVATDTLLTSLNKGIGRKALNAEQIEEIKLSVKAINDIYGAEGVAIFEDLNTQSNIWGDLLAQLVLDLRVKQEQSDIGLVAQYDEAIAAANRAAVTVSDLTPSIAKCGATARVIDDNIDLLDVVNDLGE